jgi:hypothetical protein
MSATNPTVSRPGGLMPAPAGFKGNAAACTSIAAIRLFPWPCETETVEFVNQPGLLALSAALELDLPFPVEVVQEVGLRTERSASMRAEGSLKST